MKIFNLGGQFGEEEEHQACVAISLTILMRPKVQYVGPFRFSSKEEMEREKRPDDVKESTGKCHAPTKDVFVRAAPQ